MCQCRFSSLHSARSQAAIGRGDTIGAMRRATRVLPGSGQQSGVAMGCTWLTGDNPTVEKHTWDWGVLLSQ